MKGCGAVQETPALAVQQEEAGGAGGAPEAGCVAALRSRPPAPFGPPSLPPGPPPVPGGRRAGLRAPSASARRRCGAGRGRARPYKGGGAARGRYSPAPAGGEGGRRPR